MHSMTSDGVGRVVDDHIWWVLLVCDPCYGVAGVWSMIWLTLVCGRCYGVDGIDAGDGVCSVAGMVVSFGLGGCDDDVSLGLTGCGGGDDV
eukprot:1334924-Amorphochlora_amoeboformis.AAC.3